LTLRTVNSSRSAFSCFTFKNTFFTLFEPNLIDKNKLKNNISINGDQTLIESHNRTTGNENDTLIEDIEPFKCKIPAKVFYLKFQNLLF
jgi:hypothetical protein